MRGLVFLPIGAAVAALIVTVCHAKDAPALPPLSRPGAVAIVQAIERGGDEERPPITPQLLAERADHTEPNATIDFQTRLGDGRRLPSPGRVAPGSLRRHGRRR